MTFKDIKHASVKEETKDWAHIILWGKCTQTVIKLSFNW
jgi:hypothetical protein